MVVVLVDLHRPVWSERRAVKIVSLHTDQKMTRVLWFVVCQCRCRSLLQDLQNVVGTEHTIVSPLAFDEPIQDVVHLAGAVRARCVSASFGHAPSGPYTLFNFQHIHPRLAFVYPSLSHCCPGTVTILSLSTALYILYQTIQQGGMRRVQELFHKITVVVVVHHVRCVSLSFFFFFVVFIISHCEDKKKERTPC